MSIISKNSMCKLLYKNKILNEVHKTFSQDCHFQVVLNFLKVFNNFFIFILHYKTLVNVVCNTEYIRKYVPFLIKHIAYEVGLNERFLSFIECAPSCLFSHYFQTVKPAFLTLVDICFMS